MDKKINSITTFRFNILILFKMRKVKFITFIVLFYSISFGMQAQFLKNLKNKVIEKSKDAIIEKTATKVSDDVSEKVSNQIAGAVNSVMSANIEDIMGSVGKTKDMSSLPKEYSFDYLYSLKISMAEGEMPMDYYLSESNAYMGARFNGKADMTMIFDSQNNALITVFGDNAMATELAIDSELEDETIDYKISNLPNKTFLGYDCIGRLVETDELTMTMYIRPMSKMNFGQMFNNKFTKMPNQMKMMGDKEAGIVMYAEITDKQKKNTKTTLECTAFEKSKKVIKIR